uniref:Uncharacterized protein n=1 Tax=Megaselia scalaris TaxID=36166 RepID=T1H081_MEGSC
MCFSTNGLHMSSSSSVGVLLAGGRQNTTLLIYTFSRLRPILLSHSLSFSPLLPQNGMPVLSPFSPGASPIIMIFASVLPLEKTVLFAFSFILPPSNDATAFLSLPTIHILNRVEKVANNAIGRTSRHIAFEKATCDIGLQDSEVNHENDVSAVGKQDVNFKFCTGNPESPSQVGIL